MIRQLPNGICVNVESIDDLKDVLNSEQLEMVKLLINGKDEYIEELEERVDELEGDICNLQDEIDEYEWEESVK